MPKLNPYALPRPELKVEERAFTDPLQPGAEPLKLRLRALDGVDRLKIGAAAAELAKEWAPVEEGGPFQQFMLPDGELFEPTQELFNTVAALTMMEVPDPDDQPYNLIGWIGVAKRMPNAWTQICQWAGELTTPGSNRRARQGNSPADEGNSGSPTSTSSADSATSAPATTPNS